MGLWFLLLLMSAVAAVLVCYPLRQHKIACVMLSLTVFLIPIVLYVYSGRFKSIEGYLQQNAEKQVIVRVLGQLTNPHQVITQLQHYIRQHPDEAKPRYLLGKLYLGLHDDTRAFLMLKSAYYLQPENQTYRLAYFKVKQKIMVR